MGIRLSEHKSIHIKFEDVQNTAENQDLKALFETVQSKPFNNSSHCFIATQTEIGLQLQADYCIGLDWLGKTGRYLYVEPKINAVSTKLFKLKTEAEECQEGSDLKISYLEEFELDYLKMLLQVTTVPESNSVIDGLVQINWNVKPIKINQEEDKLTPFLVVRFLQTLNTIVRKGLKKSYYRVRQNLSNKVKGKILVGQHIKQNVFKNRFVSTYCEYQVFGEDHIENRFLKKVLQFATSYVENHKDLFGENLKDLQHTINYCRPTFELISNELNEYDLKHTKYNPFYKDYDTALQIGQHILKKFAYNITQTSLKTVASPPFWIDMPRLFELYVYNKMIEANPTYKKEIHYQFSTYGNSLDILVSKSDSQMVIDTKYKLHYQNGHLHEDIRQVAGYTRLNKVREKLKANEDKNIDCLIIYPDMENGITELTLENIIKFRKEIKVYCKVFKLGIKLPLINTL